MGIERDGIFFPVKADGVDNAFVKIVPFDTGLLGVAVNRDYNTLGYQLGQLETWQTPMSGPLLAATAVVSLV